MTTQLDEIQWKNPEWIQQFGLHSINVLDYFSESPFYDRTSNNQVLKMQLQYQPPPNITNHMEYQKYFETKLSEMMGLEFIIAYTREPDFWIIRKQNRMDDKSVSILQDYYIIGANIYQAPKLYGLLSSRLLNSLLLIKKSIHVLDELDSQSSGGGEGRESNRESNTVTPMPNVAPVTEEVINFDSILNETMRE